MRYRVLSIFVLCAGVIGSYAMEQSPSGETLIIHLNELTYDSQYGLESIYRKIIPLLATEDINRLICLLHTDLLQDKRNYHKHMLFLTYVIDVIGANANGKYSLESQITRVNRYKEAISKGYLEPNDQQYLRICARLDWMLKDVAPLPLELREHAITKLLTLAAFFVHYTPFIPHINHVAELVDREDLVHYFQRNTCTRIAKMNRDLLLEPILVLLRNYIPQNTAHDAWDKLHSTIARQNLVNKEVLDRLQLRSHLHPSNDQIVFDGERWNLIDICIAQMLDCISINSLKLLITFLVNPSIQPQLVRYLFVLKFLTFAEFNEKPSPHDDLPILKEICMRIISCSDSLRLNGEELSSFKAFLHELSSVLTKEGLPAEESSLRPRRAAINALPLSQKEFLGRIIHELMIEIDGRMKQDDRIAGKRKHNELEKDETENSIVERHSAVQNLLSRVQGIGDPVLKKSVAVHILKQAPFKELFDEKQQLLERYKESSEKAALEIKTLEECEREKSEKCRMLTQALSTIKEEVQTARGTVERRLQTLEEEMKSGDDLITLYRQQLEKMIQERDRYKMQIEKEQKD